MLVRPRCCCSGCCAMCPAVGSSGGRVSGGGGGGDASAAAAEASAVEERTTEGDFQPQKRTREAAGGRTAGAAATAYLSPIAHPLLEGKLLRRSLKLIHLAADCEKANRSKNSIKATAAAGTPEGKKQQPTRSAGGATSWKLLRRGVHEVTKCLRRDLKGIVFFASDVFPIEIIAHLPILCEEKDVLYAYLCSKRTLGHAFRSQRPASVIMLTPGPGAAAPAAANKKQKRDAAAAAADDDEDAADGDSFEQLFKKVEKSIRKVHPYF